MKREHAIIAAAIAAVAILATVALFLPAPVSTPDRIACYQHSVTLQLLVHDRGDGENATRLLFEAGLPALSTVRYYVEGTEGVTGNLIRVPHPPTLEWARDVVCPPGGFRP